MHTHRQIRLSSASSPGLCPEFVKADLGLETWETKASAADPQINPWSLLQNSIETTKSVRARLQSCRKSNKIMLGFSPCGFVFSNLQFRSG